MEHTTSPRQLRLIAEVLRLADEAGVQLWLRGGWAVDFLLGAVTREHRDIDWFCWAGEIDALTGSLRQAGYEPVAGPPPEQQRDFNKDGQDLSFALLARDAVGQVVVAGGPYAGEPWPAGMLDAPAARLGDIVAPVISAEAQIEIKEMMPVWVPGLPHRTKDADDVALLQAWRARR